MSFHHIHDAHKLLFQSFLSRCLSYLNQEQYQGHSPLRLNHLHAFQFYAPPDKLPLNFLLHDLQKILLAERFLYKAHLSRPYDLPLHHVLDFQFPFPFRQW